MTSVSQHGLLTGSYLPHVHVTPATAHDCSGTIVTRSQGLPRSHGRSHARGRCGIACALGEAGAIVYCTGRSVPGRPSSYRRPETIDETAARIAAAGGASVAVGMRGASATVAEGQSAGVFVMAAPSAAVACGRSEEAQL